MDRAIVLNNSVSVFKKIKLWLLRVNNVMHCDLTVSVKTFVLKNCKNFLTSTLI